MTSKLYPKILEWVGYFDASFIVGQVADALDEFAESLDNYTEEDADYSVEDFESIKDEQETKRAQAVILRHAAKEISALEG